MHRNLLLAAVVMIALAPTPPTSAWAVADPPKQCSAHDYSAGFGGQEAACAFACDENAVVGIEVTATDTDADVSGSADCGGAHASCAGTQKCSEQNQGPTQADSAGACRANSSEVIDDGLEVHCTTNVQPEGPLPDDLICITDEICIRCPACPDPRSTTSVTLLLTDGVATAVSCWRDSCHPVPAFCAVSLDGTSCWTDASRSSVST